MTEALLYLLFGSSTGGNALARCFWSCCGLRGLLKPDAAIGAYVAVLGRSSRRLLIDRGDRIRAVPELLGRDPAVIVLCLSLALLKSSAVDADTRNGSVPRKSGDLGDAIVFVHRHLRPGASILSSTAAIPEQLHFDGRFRILLPTTTTKMNALRPAVRALRTQRRFASSESEGRNLASAARRDPELFVSPSQPLGV